MTDVENITPEVGDTHNFGKFTQLKVINNKRYYIKHRPLIWEWLFMDSNSPLCHSLKKKFPENFILSTFGLKVSQPIMQRPGMVEEVKGIINFKDIIRTEESYYNLGNQCAYYSAFGIKDLLLENFKIVNGGIQLIDAECVLYNTSELEDSYLIPQQGTIFNASFSLFPFFFELQNKDLFNFLIIGFIEGILKINNARAELSSIISEVLDMYPHAPIRVLLRSTAEYDLYLDQNISPSFPFIHEELVQLKRKDFPYFFRMPSREGVFYYVSEDYEEKKVEIQKLQSPIEAFEPLHDPKIFLNPTRLLNILLWRGIISLCRLTGVGVKTGFFHKSDLMEACIANKKITIKSIYGDDITLPLLLNIKNK